MLKNITESAFRTTVEHHLSVSLALFFHYLLVPEPISASFCLRWFRLAEINGRDTENLITGNYEAEMLWLCCNDTIALEAHVIIVELKDTMLNPSQQHVINHTHPLDTRTNNLTFRVQYGMFFVCLYWSVYVYECVIRDKVERSPIADLWCLFSQVHEFVILSMKN